MKAEEIRSEPITRDTGHYSDDSSPAIAFFLREIAAQLAELNARLEEGSGAFNVYDVSRPDRAPRGE